MSNLESNYGSLPENYLYRALAGNLFFDKKGDCYGNFVTNML